MNDIRTEEPLNLDSCPGPVLRKFAFWCVEHQARPAAIAALKRAGMDDHVRKLQMCAPVVDIRTAETFWSAVDDARDDAWADGDDVAWSAAAAASYAAGRAWRGDAADAARAAARAPYRTIALAPHADAARAAQARQLRELLEEYAEPKPCLTEERASHG